MRNNSVKVAVLVTAFAAWLAAYPQAREQVDAKAAAIMADVRKALGGEQKLAAVTALSLRADYRREMSALPTGGGGGMTVMMFAGGPGGPGGPAGGQMSGKIEIDVEFPERYLRSDIGSSGFALTRTEGFEGTRPFIEVVGNSPGMRVQADNPAADPVRAKAALKRSNAELARVLLGLIGATQPAFAVTYAYAGDAESPDGKAHIIDVAGPEDFKARLFIDTETKLPLMLTYMEPEARMVTRMMTGGAPPPGQHGGATATGAAGAAGGRLQDLTPEQRAEIEKARKEAEATPPKLVEQRLFFSDYRKVDGISMPHRIARGTAEKTTEEWDITSYKVNPTFKADRFKVGS
ncbi:MAG TPA: hypothetical protein VFJ02_04615 [Vicinamibacterales bacterium]|nr:hypothetical protein [Vicinamibacterales bacterium]